MCGSSQAFRSYIYMWPSWIEIKYNSIAYYILQHLHVYIPLVLHFLFRQYMIIGLLWIDWLVAMQFTTRLPPPMSTALLTQGHSLGDNMLICSTVFVCHMMSYIRHFTLQ